MEANIDIFEGASRLKGVAASPIRTVLDKAAYLKKQGYPVIAFSAGEPDFNTPEEIKQATIQALNNNHTHYGSNRGLLKLRELLSKKIEEEDKVTYDPETEIVITTSGAEAINNVIFATIDEGDEVIVFTPAFVSYGNLIRMCGGKVIEIPLKSENGYQINIQEVNNKITKKTKMIVINNPNNPTGAVYNKNTLKQLCEIVNENNLLILSDEMYSKLTYDDTVFYSIAAFPHMKERAIIINGFSKTYAMTGWRLGFITADERIVNSIMKVHQYSTTCSPTFIQVGLSEALLSDGTKEDVAYMLNAFAKRRKMMLNGLKKIKKLSYVKPYGAFYIMVDVSETGLTGEEFARRLLEEQYVATVPAVGLGKECVDFIRISYAASDQSIQEGLKRLQKFVESM